MRRNPYTPPTTRLLVESRDRLALHMGIGFLGGLLSWFAYVYVVRIANIYIWIPLIEAGQWRWNSTTIEMSLEAVLMFFAFGVALATLDARSRWPVWIAFVIGMVMTIAVRSFFRTNGFELAIGAFLRAPFQAAVVASGVAFFLVSRYPRARRNTSLERTIGR